ncbi:hypothetical protein HF072_11750 [Bacillus sp. RO3]|nr:hypothetical protein [Bacillus sp. RO3]
MLTALYKNKVFSTIHYTRDDLTVYRRDSFQCPHCSGDVKLKIGLRNVPHFAHLPQSQCMIGKHHESPRHLLGKKMLYERLKGRYPIVEVEHYIKQIQQIADVFIRTEAEDIAIEIQCSSIPLADMLSRNQGYKSQSITPYWLLTQEVKINQNGLVYLPPFQQVFIRYSPHLHYFLLLFSPENRSFTLYTHLIPVSSSTFISASPVKISIEDFSLPFSISVSTIDHRYLIKNWSQLRSKWIHNKLHYRKSKHDVFLKEVYEGGDTCLYLPLFVGIPVFPHALHFKSHALEWQYYVWKDCMKKEKYFTMDSLEQAMSKRLERGHLEVRPLPMVSLDEGTRRAVNQYLVLLEAMQIIRKAGGGRFQLSVPWVCPDTFSSFEKHQHDFNSKWKHILKKV